MKVFSVTLGLSHFFLSTAATLYTANHLCAHNSYRCGPSSDKRQGVLSYATVGNSVRRKSNWT